MKHWKISRKIQDTRLELGHVAAVDSCRRNLDSGTRIVVTDSVSPCPAFVELESAIRRTRIELSL
jgi:hypothetical protein